MEEKEVKKLFEVDLNVKTMVQLAMFMALTIVLGYVNKIIPEMPQGGTISIDIIAIFLCAYLMGTGYGVICGVGVAILQFALGIASYWGPWSVLLDYVLPLAVCGLAGLLKPTKIGSVPIYWGIIFAMFLKYISHFLSGAFLFAEYAPEGMNPIIYSLGYNLPYNLVTMILCMVVVPILCPRLKSVFHK
ncbi:MAG: energy-coupled thiamine transporter ThiT [Coprobacillus cateniformis]|nr:putative proton-coupled thiamine transporter YuaJ [Candidatus Stoquefichus sp. KLE1796]MBS5369238.1 energy-coupled thiamine transporter ThiT [Coprobacillus cateniformis]